MNNTPINITPANMKNLDAELYGKIVAAAESVPPERLVSFSVRDRKLMMCHIAAEDVVPLSDETRQLFTTEELASMPVWAKAETYL